LTGLSDSVETSGAFRISQALPAGGVAGKTFARRGAETQRTPGLHHLLKPSVSAPPREFQPFIRAQRASPSRNDLEGISSCCGVVVQIETDEFNWDTDSRGFTRIWLRPSGIILFVLLIMSNERDSDRIYRIVRLVGGIGGLSHLAAPAGGRGNPPTGGPMRIHASQKLAPAVRVKCEELAPYGAVEVSLRSPLKAKVRADSECIPNAFSPRPPAEGDREIGMMFPQLAS